MPLANLRLSGSASMAAILQTRSLMKQAINSDSVEKVLFINQALDKKEGQ
jgi:hypothetical protein